MTMRSKQWYTKTSRLENSFAKSSIGRRSSDLVSTTRSSTRRPVESKFQIFLASFLGRWSSVPFADFLLGLPDSTSRQSSSSPAYLFSTDAGLFVEDQFT